MGPIPRSVTARYALVLRAAAVVLAALPPPSPASTVSEQIPEDADARAREQAADEDPLSLQQLQALKEAEEAPSDQRPPEPNQLDIYGSLRIRYRSESGSHAFSDGGSRVGIRGRYQFLPRKWLFARAEAGFNLLDEIRAQVNPSANPPDVGPGDTFFRRLAYVGYESPNLFLVFGKTWSVYYKVSGFTDRFASTGGQAGGTFNARTDGGYTGTGRAENAFQTRILVDFLPERWGVEPFSLNLQVQDGERIPGMDGHRYGTTVGVSAILTTRDDFSLGVAYNHARVPNSDQAALRRRGIDGDARALAVGARWYSDDWYLATLLARMNNHETTNQGNYFDGWGMELYAQYRFKGNWWLTGGGNWLEPDGDQSLAGDYRIKFGVIGLRYTLRGFDRFLYANLRAERSRRQNGDAIGNVVTAGLRWNF